MITSIIWSGSSEHTGFSAVIYGDNIPTNQRIKIISLHDTQSVTQRQTAEKAVDAKLRNAFRNIQSVANFDDRNHDNNEDDQDDNKYADMGNDRRRRLLMMDYKQDDVGDTKSIGLVPAFKIATGQSRPHHRGDRKAKLGYSQDDKSIGDHDNQQAYFIFDHRNRLLSDNDNDNNADICQLFHHLDNNAIENDDEAPYFLMGSTYTQSQVDSITCNGVKPEYITEKTFYHFSSRFAFNKVKMERIFELSCPAEVKSKRYKGSINVGNHVQYIDQKTVMKCNLFYYDHDNDESTPEQLDRHKSYVQVKDFVNDDNTFKLYDYLMSPPKEIGYLRSIDCNAPTMKIVKIIHDDEIYGRDDSNDANDYKILKLYVRLPSTPMEYMSEANIDGNVAHRRRRGSYQENGKPYHSQTDDQNDQDDNGEDHHNDNDNEKSVDAKPDEEKDRDDSNDNDHAPDAMDDDGDGDDNAPPSDDFTDAKVINFDNNLDYLDEDEVIEFDEVDILKGKMNDMMEDNFMLDAIGHSILLERVKRVKRVMIQHANARKYINRLHRKYKRNHYRIGKKLPVFGAKLMEEQFLGKIGSFFKKVGKGIAKVAKKVVKTVGGVVKGVVKTVGNLIKGKVDFKVTKDLVNLSFKKDWTFVKTLKLEKTFGSKQPNGFKVIIKGNGILELKFGFWFKFKAGVYFKFFWKIWGKDRSDIIFLCCYVIFV